MSSAPPPPSHERPDRDDSTLGAFGRMVQGLLLEWVTIGVVLLGLVVIAGGFIEGSGAGRILAVVVGLLAIVVVAIGLRRHWDDSVRWAAMILCTAAEFAAFAFAVASGR